MILCVSFILLWIEAYCDDADLYADIYTIPRSCESLTGTGLRHILSSEQEIKVCKGDTSENISYYTSFKIMYSKIRAIII